MIAKRSTLYVIFSVFFIYLLTGCALAATDGTSGLSTKEDSWDCSKEILITENAGKDLQGYPVAVCLNSSNFNFSEAKSDGSDLRFSSGDRTLNYWIETWDPENEEALIWVRLPSLSANQTAKILMRYGNPGAEAVSSGEKTFDFFDDFEDNNLNELDWNAESAGGGLVEVKNGVCNVAAPKVHAYDSSTIYSKESFEINSMFVVKRMKVTTGADNRGPVLQQGFIDQIDSRKNEIKHETELANESRVDLETIYRKQKNNLYDLTDVNVPEGEWYVSGIAWYEENDIRKVSWFKNEVRDPRMDFASNDSVTNFPMHVYLYAASYKDASKNTGYMAVDYVLVRKFVGTEPTVKIISAQEEGKVSSENVSENSTGNSLEIKLEFVSKNNSGNSHGNDSESTSENTIENHSENISEPQSAIRSEINPETSASEKGAQAQKNLSQNETGTPENPFHEYEVETSGIRLSSPYGFDFSTLVDELNSSGIDTIFLSVDNEDVWQYERFVKMAHEEGISVHAVLLEDVNCTKKGAGNLCQNSLDTVLDYNEKSLAPFDGVDIYINSSALEGSEENAVDYKTLFETANKEAEENLTISASLPLNYTALQIKEIAPFIDFFIIRAYPGETEELNSVSGIVDAVALEMGEIRGAGSRGIIEISVVEEGFKDKYSIQQLFSGLADYYSDDSAFRGVSIFNYDTYKELPQTQPEEKESPIPGFNVLPVILAGLGAFVHLKGKKN